MKLLIITQKVDQNDAILGFFIGWLKKFAEVFDEVKVITLFKGQYDLPNNVEVFSLGKESGKGRLSRWFKFYKLIRQLLPEVDAALGHMCPEYICAISPLNKKFNKPLFLWYTHKSVSKYLIKTEKMVEKIFTASSESCRVQSDKIIITGHGLDLDYWQPAQKSNKDHFEIIIVGRIAPVKNLETLIEAINQLNPEVKEKIRVKIIGEPLLDQDKKYQNNLNSLVTCYMLHDIVEFVGPMAYHNLLPYYQQADLLVNLSKTGSIDKVVLEAMACKVAVLTSNEAFKNILPSQFLVKQDNGQELAQKITEFYHHYPTVDLRPIVSENHSLDKLIKQIHAEIKKHL